MHRDDLPLKDQAENICPRPDRMADQATWPMAAAIYPASVWACQSPDQALAILNGDADGYVYQRDRHPNADMLAEKCCGLHHSERSVITSSGMAAMSAALLSQVERGDHVVASSRLYGRSLTLLDAEASRLGIETSVVDTCDLAAVRDACHAKTRLIVAETISNPVLRVADIAGLANVARQCGAKLLIDNTFATPVLCRPRDLGADLVMESISKMMNGHSDVMLGVLCGQIADWQRVPLVVSAWGLASSPFDCWLATRGLATLPLRFERAADNAMQVARFLESHPSVKSVDYPGLESHPDHDLARQQFGDRFGSMVTFHLAGGREAATSLIQAVAQVPFSPSLGEVSTTLSHPESTSHRGHTPDELHAQGIDGGTIRLSVGVETIDFIVNALKRLASGG